MDEELSESRLESARGVAVGGGQLIVADAWRIVFWNDRPFLEIRPPLPVAGGGELKWTGGLNIGGIAVSPDASFLWLSDPSLSTVFRVRDPLTQPVVDIVLGHPNLTETRPNNGGKPARDSLSYPGALALDRRGDLFVADHALEVAGNHRAGARGRWGRTWNIERRTLNFEPRTPHLAAVLSAVRRIRRSTFDVQRSTRCRRAIPPGLRGPHPECRTDWLPSTIRGRTIGQADPEEKWLCPSFARG